MSEAPVDPLPDDWEHQDSIGSYYVAIAAIGEQVRAGAELPAIFRPRRDP